MRPLRISVIGAGPAGLAAAIELARRGAEVTVYEQHRSAGRRFHGDLQALENWTAEEDVLTSLQRLGVAIDFPHRAVHEMTWADWRLGRRVVKADRPLLYVVKRGPEPDSLDSRLAAQAGALGVAFRFGRRVRPPDLAGPVIVASGPRGTQGIVAGIVARTSHADQIVAISADELAPKGYAYCVVWGGRATLATVLMRDFERAWPCLDATRRAFARLGLSDFREMRRFGGRAHVSATGPLVDGSRLYVGEAAGLQDYLLGFGLRYALVSGHLAARTFYTRERYDTLVATHLRGLLRAGFVNRLLFNRLGDRGYRWLVRWLSRARDARRRAGRLYAFTPLHRALWPLARRALHGGEDDRPLTETDRAERTRGPSPQPASLFH